MAQMRQSTPDSGLGFKAKVLETFSVVSSSIGNGCNAPKAKRGKQVLANKDTHCSQGGPLLLGVALP
jgi:hypothetical protein